MAATLNKLSFLTADGVQGSYLQGWIPTGWDSAAKPDLPAGMIIVVAGYPYQVIGGNLTPSGTPADGPVYIKITPNPADAGATALAAFVVTWPATWSETYNGWYDGSDLYLNAFMTKAGANYASKGFWLNFREKKVSVVSNDITAGNAVFSGDVAAVNGIFSGDVEAVNGDFSGNVGAVNGTFSGDIFAGSTRVVMAPTGSVTRTDSTTQSNVNLPVMNTVGSIELRRYTSVQTKTFTTHSTVGRKYYIQFANDTTGLYGCGVFGPSELVYTGTWAEFLIIRIQ